MRSTPKLIALLLMLLPLFHVSAQDIDDLIERYSGSNVNGYIGPMVTAFGANLNSGYFVGALVPESGFHLDLRLKMAAFFSDDQRVFDATTQGAFVPEQQVETSTIVGDGIGATVGGSGGTNYTFPGGYDLGSLATVVPTLTVGSLYGTEAAIRYISVTVDEDVGKLELLGIGIRHSISQYIPASAVDLAIGFAFTDLELGSIIKIQESFFHAEVGKTIPFFQVYGGLGFESNTADIRYTPEDSDSEVDINVKGDNKFRMFTGFGIDLYILHLSLDYSFGNQSVLNAGLSFGL